METQATLTQDETLALAQVVAAMRRIARKPWPHEHHRQREFYKKDGTGLKRLRMTGGNGRNGEMFDPLWMPSWAIDEGNPCDCPKCIAIRVLHQLDEQSKKSRAKAS